MINKNNNIRQNVHPYSNEIDKQIVWLEKTYNIMCSVLYILGSITAFVAAIGLAEWADGIGGGVADVPVNFFGYFIEIESDTFGAAPITVFLYTFIVVGIIRVVLACIKRMVIVHLQAKKHMLDSLYHSEQMMELLVRNTFEEENAIE